MGKKRVIQKTEKELIAETDKVEQKLKKELNVQTAKPFRKGRIYVSSTYNNTIVSLADERGNVLFWRSAGNIGFKGTKKGTSFAASKVAQAVALACDQFKIKEVSIFVKGVGGGRDSALKTISAAGVEIEEIKDVTPVPHNGCRPKKPRRV
ncbi:MAG: 30S ribosomal protein S11 [Candidatus Pacebacteria bacterium]|nr:30S ribosomal protein S11 [Candidatus Paceibacterota bacterium]